MSDRVEFAGQPLERWELAELLGIAEDDVARILRVDVMFDNLIESWTISADLRVDDE